MRTTKEILERLEDPELAANDFFGVRFSELVSALPYDAAKPYLKAEVTDADWVPVITNDNDIKDAMVTYLDFAIGKAEDHRGLSAGRSIDHFTAWLWLLGDEEIFSEFVEAPYQNYGCPQLAVVIKHFDPERSLSTQFMNMAQSEPCESDCYEGCES